MRLALAQLNFTVGAFDANVARIQRAVGRARTEGADLVVFTEMAATGYPPRDLLNHSSFVERNLRALDDVAAMTDQEVGILIGFVDPNPGEGKRLYNAVALCHEGRVAARRAKSLLPTYDVFDEGRYFEPAHDVAPIVFKGVPLGVTICEDVWNDRDFWPRRLYHRDPVSDLSAQGARFHINISASPFGLGKAALRRQMIRQEAVKHGCHFFYVNQVGGNDELLFDGHSLGFDPQGEVVLRAKDFEEDFLVFDLPTDAHGGGSPTDARPILHEVSQSTAEETYKALVLGLRDYTRKCGFSTVVLGLSGGVDSALTACLAADALGPSAVHGIAMPTRFSSEHSVRDARALADNLGIRFDLIEIDSIFQAYLDRLAPVFVGRPADVTEENVQARIRGGVLMALSNKFASLLLTTGNKSELAVGYCTLYGDMAGGLAVISDVPKTAVYDLARFVNRDGPRIPVPTLLKAPSAELRPNQTDQDTLPPYDILDRVLNAYVEQDMEVDQIVALGIERAVVVDVVRRINQNEYKRRQAAPGLKMTSKAFGIGRRYPVAADYGAVSGTSGPAPARASGTPPGQGGEARGKEP